MADLSGFTPYPEDPRYGVSRDGRVCRRGVIQGWSAGEIKPHICSGYLCVNMMGKRMRVNRVVAETFIPNPQNKPEVAHADRDVTNNNVSNLRWATRQENEDDKWDHGTRPLGEIHGMAKLTLEDIRDIKKMFKGKIPFSPPFYTDVAKMYGVTHQNIMLIVKNRSWIRAAAE